MNHDNGFSDCESFNQLIISVKNSIKGKHLIGWYGKISLPCFPSQIRSLWFGSVLLFYILLQSTAWYFYFSEKIIPSFKLLPTKAKLALL